MGQRSPDTAIAVAVEDGINHGSHLGLAWPPTGAGRRQEGLQDSPLLACQITGVWLQVHTLSNVEYPPFGTDSQRGMTGLADSVLTGSLTPFSGPVSAPFFPSRAGRSAGGQLGELMSSCERSGNSFTCDGRSIAWLGRAGRSLLGLRPPRHMSRDRSTAATWLATAWTLLEFAILAAQLIAACQQRSHQDRRGVFVSSACSKIGDAPIASASLPGAQSSHETFDKRNKKPRLRQAENVTSRPTSHQPTLSPTVGVSPGDVRSAERRSFVEHYLGESLGSVVDAGAPSWVSMD